MAQESGKDLERKSNAELGEDELDQVAGGVGVRPEFQHGAEGLHEGGGADPLHEGSGFHTDFKR